jgi:hypothetical protein
VPGLRAADSVAIACSASKQMGRGAIIAAASTISVGVKGKKHASLKPEASKKYAETVRSPACLQARACTQNAGAARYPPR